MGEQYRPKPGEEHTEKALKFAQIERAFEILTNPASRQKYDAVYQRGLSRTSAYKKIDDLVVRHAKELIRKRRQFTTDNGYGIKDRTRWDQEIEFFFEKVVPQLNIRDPSFVNEYPRKRVELILDSLPKDEENLTIDRCKTGIDFEGLCAEILSAAGWKVSTTQASGDQGADLVIKKGKLTAVVQCKYYSRPVGNAAVQEAHSAKSHYGTKFACVVSNKPFTKSASELGRTTGVVLLHHDDLIDLEKTLKAEI